MKIFFALMRLSRSKYIRAGNKEHNYVRCPLSSDKNSKTIFKQNHQNLCNFFSVSGLTPFFSCQAKLVIFHLLLICKSCWRSSGIFCKDQLKQEKLVERSPTASHLLFELCPCFWFNFSLLKPLFDRTASSLIFLERKWKTLMFLQSHCNSKC